MRRVYSLIERVRDTDVPVLITGESGTGKEVVARAIHAASARSKARTLGVNCGAIPENLLESELFGHVKGAFTGADRDRKGLFRDCQGGTILLDEIGETPLKMQAGLLRVLQERRVRPVGGSREEEIDVRMLFATNRDLSKMVAEGKFREDLYSRSSSITFSDCLRRATSARRTASPRRHCNDSRSTIGRAMSVSSRTCCSTPGCSVTTSSSTLPTSTSRTAGSRARARRRAVCVRRLRAVHRSSCPKAAPPNTAGKSANGSWRPSGQAIGTG